MCSVVYLIFASILWVAIVCLLFITNGGLIDIKGSEWTYKVFFYPYADNHTDDVNLITFEELIQQFENGSIPNARLKSVYLYKHPLEEYMESLMNVLFYHEYVVVQTSDGMWWSFEKNGKGIIVQRGKSIQSVRDFKMKTYRMTNGYWEPQQIRHMDGIMTVKRLISVLNERDWQDNMYHFFYANCQAFSEYVYSLGTGNVSRVDWTVIVAGFVLGFIVCIHWAFVDIEKYRRENSRFAMYILFGLAMVIFLSRLTVIPNTYAFRSMDNMWRYDIFYVDGAVRDTGNCSSVAFEERMLKEVNIESTNIDISCRYPLIKQNELLDIFYLVPFYPYVVFKDNNGRWWSLEENGEGILIQRGIMTNDCDLSAKSTKMSTKFRDAVIKDHKGEIMSLGKMIKWFVRQKEMHIALSTYFFNYIIFVALMLSRIWMSIRDMHMIYTFDRKTHTRYIIAYLAVSFCFVLGVYICSFFVFFSILFFYDTFNAGKAICFCICYFVYVYHLSFCFRFLREYFSRALSIILIGIGICAFVYFITIMQIL